jgi:MSHA biogenesis protein MshJ
VSASLKNSIQKWRERFDALQPRERNIILILALVVVAFLWDLLCYSPLQRSITKTQDGIVSTADQITQLGNQVRELTQPGSGNPVRVLQDRKQNLKVAIKQLDSSIEQLTGNLIPAKKMVQVLEDVLRQSSNLQLVAVKNLPVRRLITGTEADISVTHASDGALYLHAVELELRGSYFETLSYLQALEGLPWQVIWDQLEYRVDRYPQADIRLRINTLSSSAGLLGV